MSEVESQQSHESLRQRWHAYVSTWSQRRANWTIFVVAFVGGLISTSLFGGNFEKISPWW